MTQEHTAADDVEPHADPTADAEEVAHELLEDEPVVRAFSNEVVVKMLVVLADAGDGALSPGDITEQADVDRRNWYNYREMLLDVGLVAEAGKVGNSQTYTLNTDEEPGRAFVHLYDAMGRYSGIGFDEDDDEDEADVGDDGDDGPLSDAQKREMFEWFESNEYEYREDPHTDATVVYEDADHVVVADTSGHELNEWADDFGIDRSELSAWMHDRARDIYDAAGVGDPWSVADPVVFEKFE